MNSDFNRLVDQITPAPAPSADELRAIVTRARSRTWRVMSVAVAVALSAAVIVAVVGWPTTRTVRTVTAPLGPAALAVAVSAASAPTSAGQPPPITFSSLFFRTTTDEVTIRAHLGTITGPLPCPPDQPCPAHLPHTIVHVGLSTDAVVGEMAVPADGPPPPVLGLAGASGFGLPGVAAGFALIFRAGASVARVHLSFADGGSDEMTPVDGWVVLAHVGQSPFGTVEALDAGGRVLGSTPISPTPPPAAHAPGNGQSPGVTPASPAQSS